MAVKIEKRGTRYGYWTVREYAGIDKQGNAMWWCTCENCGRDYRVRGFSLRAGKTKHCRHCNRKGCDK